MAYKILIADDEADIIEILEYNLLQNGYIVITARNGNEAIEKALSEKPDLLLLDIMMPGKNGIEVCEFLRESNECNESLIAILTARSEDYSQIAAFEAGADDYITKPIKPKLLLVKLQSLLKRKRFDQDDSEKLDFGELIIDKKNRVVSCNNQVLHLPRKEFDLLVLLSSKPEILFTRNEIYRKIWGHDICIGDRTIDVHIRKIREKIGEKYIQTIKGIGYKFLK